jgi:hypothetical protein
VQVMCTVSAMQSAGHDHTYGIGSIVPALATNARTGHPASGKGGSVDALVFQTSDAQDSFV